MKTSVLTYTIGFVLLAIFLAGDLLPIAQLVQQPVAQELITQPEEESSGKSAEGKTGFERGEYCIDHASPFSFIVPISTAIKVIPGNTFCRQKVFLSIPTPPPDCFS